MSEKDPYDEEILAAYKRSQKSQITFIFAGLMLLLGVGGFFLLQQVSLIIPKAKTEANTKYQLKKEAGAIPDEATPGSPMPEEVINNEPTSAQIQVQNCDSEENYATAEFMLSDGRYDQLESFYNNIHKQCGEFLELRWLVFFGAKKQGDFKQAERLVTALITKYPDDSDYRVWRGRLYQHYKLSVKAIADFEAAIRLFPEIEETPLILAKIYADLNEPCRASVVISTYMNHYPHLKKKASIAFELVGYQSACEDKER